jgi:hypothetical protein
MKLPCGCCQGVEKITPAEIFNRPGLPALLYRMGTHSTLFETMQASLASWPISLPGPTPTSDPVNVYPLRSLTTRDTSDPSIALLDAWAVVGDVLTFYQERIANEGFLRTALHHCSILELARLVGYRLRPGVAASVFLAFTLEQGADKNKELPVPEGTRAQSVPGPGELPQAFETSADLVARSAWNALKPRLTRTQKITADGKDLSFGAANIETIFFDGTSTKLKAGDALLIVCDETPGNQFLRYVDGVNPDDKNQRTEVTLQLPPQAVGSDALTNLTDLIARFVTQGTDLFPESKVIGDVIAILNGVNAAVTQTPPLAYNQIVEQARLALPQLQNELELAEKRNFTRMSPWIAELIREWEAYLADPGGPPHDVVEEAAVAAPTGSIRFGQAIAPRLSGFLALNSIVEKLALPPSTPPPSPTALKRNLSVAFSQAADNLPQLLTGLRSELVGSLYDAWKNLELPPNPVKIYALRTRARLYGHSAPPRVAATDGEGVVTLWGEWGVFHDEQPVQNNDNQPPSDEGFPPASTLESAGAISLDSSYQAIVAGSWVVLKTEVPISVTKNFLTPGYPPPDLKSPNLPNLQFARAGIVQVDAARSDYGMSSKTSRIILGVTNDPRSSYDWIDTSTASKHSTDLGANFWVVRQTAVYAQSEELTLADAPIENDVFGSSIELDDLYDGLKPGRWMIVSGNRSDIPGTSGVAASELVMLAGVTQGGQAAQCASYPYKTIPFTSVFYVTDPNAQGDRLVVGAPSAYFKTLMQQLPSSDPNSPNQTYCAPLELAPGFYGQAYVPTSDDTGPNGILGERSGNFPAFDNLLIDPKDGSTFDGGQIDKARWGVDVGAWRIVSTRDSVHTTIQLAAPLNYTYDPPTVTVYANVAKATHGQTQSEILGSGDASQTLQNFSLSKSPLTYLSAPTPSGTDTTLVVRVNGIEWHGKESLADMDPGSRTYFTEEDHDGVTSVTFGDGVHGSRVPTGPSNVKAVYRSGIGAPGNVDAGKISQLATRPLGVKEVINPLPSTGGADADTLEQARSNVPIAVMALDRLVSLSDYAFFTRNYAGVAKASAIAFGSSSMTHVTFAGVGDVPVDPTSDFFQNLSDSLVKFGDPLEPVQLARRSALLLVIKAEVRVLPDYLWENVSPVVRAAMLRKFGFDYRELEQDAVLSEVFSTIQSVEGVDYVKIDAFGAISDVDDAGKPLTPDDLTKVLKNLIQTADPAKLPSRIVANSARPGASGILPAQIAYLSATVQDCLLLSELKP